MKEPQFKSYTSSFISVDTQLKSAALGSYLAQVEYLDPKVRSSVSYVLENLAVECKPNRALPGFQPFTFCKELPELTSL